MSMNKDQDVKLAGIPCMSVGSLVSRLARVYCTVVEQGTPLKAVPSVMLWGPPGIGKSQAVRQIANVIEEQTGKRVSVTDVRLLLFNPIDLRGIPTANADKTLAIWLKPQIFQMEDSPDVVNILFLDEISAAPQSVQAAAYQIVLDRVVGEHRLPENCIVMAAGNRMTDKSVAFKMPKALANRLMHIEVEGSFESWRKWAVGVGIDPRVMGFLSFRQDALMDFDTASEDLAFATPRSWEMVSNLLNASGESIKELYPLICGLVGTGAASELRTWEQVYRDLPNIEDIFDGRMPELPTSTDALYALVSSMVAYAWDHRDQLDRIGNSIAYANKLPADYSVVLMRDYQLLEPDYTQKLLSIPAYTRWLSSKGALLNGSVK